MELQLNGLVVGPDEVLVVTLPEDTLGDPGEIAKALEDVGLSGRALVLVGATLATIPREA